MAGLKDDKDQRRHERFPFIEDVLIDGTKSCRSMDISEGGLFISAIQSFEDGEVVEVAISTKNETITAKAQIKYSQPGIGMGIAFVDLNDDLRIKIKKLVESASNKPN